VHASDGPLQVHHVLFTRATRDRYATLGTPYWFGQREKREYYVQQDVFEDKDGLKPESNSVDGFVVSTVPGS
jgi:hypothetical protein